MNSIDIKDVQRMAILARLDIAKETQELFAGQFGNILSHMDTLAHVDTNGVEPLYSPVTHEGALREDVSCTGMENKAKRQDVLSNTPKENEQYFVVPRIV